MKKITNKIKQKKAELTTENIVALIVIIIGFIILLAFLVGFNYKEEVDQFVCKASVLLKTTSKQLTGLKSISTSLNCHTQYICISKDNKCDKSYSSTNVKTVSSTDEIYKILSEQLANCWSMFGEGKLDYFNAVDFNLKKSTTYCSLCSEIIFDKDLYDLKDSNNYFEKDENEKIVGLNQTKFYMYLAKTRIGNSEDTYLNYLYGISSFAKVNQELNDLTLIDSSNPSQNQKILIIMPPLNFSKNYFVLLGAVDDNNELLNFLYNQGGIIFGGGLGIAAAIMTGGTSLIVTLPAAAVGAGIGYGTQTGVHYIQDLLFSRGKQDSNGEISSLRFIGPNLMESDSNQIKNFKCSEINTFA